jgi:dGTPase
MAHGLRRKVPTSLITRIDIEKRERNILAPYAALSAESRGRQYPQAEHPLRTVFQRDRDRIVHSAAFRRLEFKTQVFLPHEGDHFRTRLTHSIEVAQIGRTIARNLRLNEDLTEAIALVHDLGHTPFGHSGEDVLDELLADRGGFNHNEQSLRVVDVLEQRYPEHPGLNLSFEVREGIAKHETTKVFEHPDFDPGKRPTLEASLVDLADEISYNAHDIDDGIRSGLITLGEVTELSIWTEKADLSADRTSTQSGSDEEHQIKDRLVRWLLNRIVTDVMEETSRRIVEAEITDVDSVRDCKRALVDYSPELQNSVSGLKDFLRTRLYHHPRLEERARHASRIITGLFERFSSDLSLMPPRFQEMLLTEDSEVVIADYIAGMTDRYAESVYSRLFR